MAGQFGQTHVLDPLANVCPIDVTHPFPARKPAQQVSLVFGPGKDVAFLQAVWHAATLPQTGDDCQKPAVPLARSRI